MQTIKIIGLKDREGRIATSESGVMKVEGLKGNKDDFTFIGQFLKVLQRENRKGVYMVTKENIKAECLDCKKLYDKGELDRNGGRCNHCLHIRINNIENGEKRDN